MGRLRRKAILIIIFAVASVWLVQEVALAVDEPEYEVVASHGDFELRRYDPMILAETHVESNFEGAGNQAFRRLFRYISGNNTARAKIEMTAPVTQEAVSQKIDMTAPVVQEADGSGWSVAFVLPADITWETAPEPNDSMVELRLVPERLMAAIRFSGGWGEDRFSARESELRALLAEHDLQAVGSAVYARYNAPFTPWFLRRNEVMIPVSPGVDTSG